MATKAGTIEYTHQTWQGPIANQSERVAAAQERLKRERLAPKADEASFAINPNDAQHIVKNIGLANCAQSVEFVKRVLEMESRLTVNEMLLADARVEIADLKARLPR